MHRDLLLTCTLLALVAIGALLWRGRRQSTQVRRGLQRAGALQAQLDDTLALLHALPAAVIGADHLGVVRYLNPSAERMTGMRAVSAAGRPLREVLVLQQDGVMVDARTCLQGASSGAGKGAAGPSPGTGAEAVAAQLRRPDNSRLDIEYRCAPLAAAGAAVVPGVASGGPGMVAVLHDVSARRGIEARLEFIAHHDSLTGLPNRQQFQLRLEHGIAYARRHRGLLAVLFVDIDRFKVINDSLGHEVGDQVLVQFAQRMQRCMRQVDTVARLGGDEFIVLLNEMRAPQDAERVASQILAAIALPFVIGQNSLVVAASVGMAIFPDDDEDIDALIEKADLAMYAAKHRGVGAWLRYAPSMQAKAYSRMILETALRHALEQHEFVLTYQPKLELKTGRINGVKALIRWKHPELGLVMPLDFMPVLEDSALILPVGAWVLETALAQALHWIGIGQPLTVSVNVSARQFYQKDIAASFAAILAASGVPGHYIELEITESVLIDKNPNCEAILRHFKELGMGISIGDFGTGYASLNYLKRFPVDVVKIDKSFVDDLKREGGGGHADDGAMVRAIIVMAHSLKMKVIASGVETEAQLAQLAAMDCDEAFGFCLSRAVAPSAIEALIKSRRQVVPVLQALPVPVPEDEH